MAGRAYGVAAGEDRGIFQMAQDMKMEDYKWGNAIRQTALRAAVGRSITAADMTYNRQFAEREHAAFGAESVLSGDSLMVVRARENIKALGLWEIATQPGPVRSILNGTDTRYKFFNKMDPLLNKWLVPLELFVCTLRQLQGRDLDLPGPRRPVALGLVPSRAQGIDLFMKLLNLCYGTGIIPKVIHGTSSRVGVYVSSYHKQMGVVEGNCDILVGSPGRLLHILEGHYRQRNISLLCIDHAQHFDKSKWVAKFFTPLRELNIIRETTSISVHGCAFSQDQANRVRTQLGIDSAAPQLCDRYGSVSNTGISRNVTQAIVPVEDGPHALLKAVELVTEAMRGDQKTIIILQRRDKVDQFQSDLVQELGARGMRHPGERIRTMSANTSQRNNEDTLAKFLNGTSIKVLVGTPMLTEISDFEKVDNIIWMGIPRYGLDYRNGLVRVFRSGVGMCGRSTMLVTRMDHWDVDEIAPVVAEGGSMTLEEAKRALKAAPEPMTEQLLTNRTSTAYVYKRNGRKCHRCSRVGHEKANCSEFP